MASVGNVSNSLLTPADVRQRWDTSTLAGVGLIFVAALIHVVLAPEHFEATPYLGALFVADFAGAMAAAIGICVGAYWGRRWGWALAALVAGGVFVAYFAVGTVGLPGMGAIAKAVEPLFLVIVGFGVVGSFAGLRRWALLGGIAAVLVVPVLAVALGFLTPDSAQAGPGPPVKWRAASPATNAGDQYSLVVTNTGDEAQQVNVKALIMDPRAKTNTPLITEQLELAPGEEREFTATNDYGDAPHIVARLGSETQDLGLSVKLTDSSGKETARYDQGAFWIQ